jgi:hypothetical protein
MEYMSKLSTGKSKNRDFWPSFLAPWQPFSSLLAQCGINAGRLLCAGMTMPQFLEDIVLAKERGLLKNLTSMSMEFDWGFRSCPFSEEDIRGVAAI